MLEGRRGEKEHSDTFAMTLAKLERICQNSWQGEHRDHQR